MTSRLLKDLAAQGLLPAHQVMDQATLTWIVRHRPAVGVPPAVLPHRPVLLMPEVTWFANTELADSIHGIGHGARVCVLASLLAQEHELSRVHTTALCVAAAVHDCRRHDDHADPGHGKRAAHWLTSNGDTIMAALGQRLPAYAVAWAATAIGLHDISYEAFTPADTRAYERVPLLIDLLKGADCLDRYRLPLQRWWPDLSHLRVPIPGWLQPVAFDLMARSAQARLNGVAHHEALTHALQTFTFGQ
ncbi:hypothetical protein FHS43_001853 [Streptosporangium becharense]|uniref:HD/PDEase domain-containing protein n=1 Tax=Streptosporangium becharense TaxID=1816182 RepID=A0A7W9MEI9_9ACTN|nr:hypothetical protein [Streptosporangium becharense]MBB2910590.1 hypothetical protein [Streptosporangium becharense]MBB5817288.1 hypothetical protein [Streptosporangium becharense]